jgi:uncharacterized protein YjbJ (UPF0337 family)
MNWDQIEGKWKRFTGSARERWGKLTDNDWETIAGRKDQLVGRIQERYGVAKAEAEKQADEWSRAEAIQARTPRRHPPLAIAAKRIYGYQETGPGASRASVVQMDARGANVALTRPIRVPEMRPAARGGLGTTSASSAAHAGIALRVPGRRPGGRNPIENPMLVATTLAVLVLLSLILSMVPSPNLAARVRASRLPRPAPLPAVA